MDESSDESMDETTPGAKTTRNLGYLVQKEFSFNRHLNFIRPDELDEESEKILRTIKRNLALALVHKEMNPGLGICAAQLMCYIKLYGLKFSKEDHVKFIKILMQLVCIPHLETAKVSKFCTILNQLLGKCQLLSPDDLQIEWRPLYELAKIYLKRNSNKCVMHRFFSNLENSLQFLITRSSIYFPKSSTQEILDEILHTMEPLDSGKGCDSFEMLVLFLTPYDGYDLWLEKVLKLWDTYQNPVWSSDIMNSIGPAARNNIGKIDWEPHIPSIFTRIMRALQLPVTYKNMTSTRNQTLNLCSAALWIVSTLGPQSSAQDHLNYLLGAIETYVHPANTGKWLEMISELLVHLVMAFERRLIDERYMKKSWIRPIPESHRLTEECITRFVNSLKNVAMQALYSRMNPNDVGKIFKVLADLRPEIIIPGVIERLSNSLELLTEPLKLTASLQTLIRVARPLVTGHNGYVEGKAQVIPILMGLLPGLDPNDFRKTCLVLQFYVSFSLLVPMVDCSKASQHYDDLTEEEIGLCEQTAVMEDFVLQFMERIFVLIDARSSPTFRLAIVDGDSSVSKLESIAESSILSSVHTILSQSSKEIIALAAHKLIQFVRTHIFESKVAASLVGGMVRIMGRVAGHSYYKAIVPYLLQTLREFFDDPEVPQADKQREEFLYYLQLLLNVLRGDPMIVIDYVEEILPVIDQALTFKCPSTTAMANNMILHMLLNFSIIQTDTVNYPEIWTKTLAEFLPVRHWGSTLPIDEKLVWYVPDQRVKELCQRIIYRYLMPALEFFEKYIRGDGTEPSREEMLKNINLLSALLRANNMLPNWSVEEGGAVDIVESIVTDYQFDLKLGFEDVQISMPDGSNIRQRIVEVMIELQDKLLERSEDDIKSFKALLQVWDKVHMRKHGNHSFDTQLKNYNCTKAFQEFRLTHRKRSIRCVVALRAAVQQNLRDEMAKPMFTMLHEKIAKKLLQLSTSKYSGIRMVAQSKLLSFLNAYPFSYRCIVDDLVQILQLDPTEHHDQFKGALYLLNGNRSNRLLVKHDWVAVRKLWTALLSSRVSEKPSVTKLLDAMIEIIKFDFPTINIRLTFPEECLALSRTVCPADLQISAERIAAGCENEQATNGRNENMYYEIANEIINIVRTESLHWRYNFLASSMLLNLVHPNVKHQEIVARYFLNNLLSDSLPERKIAVQGVSYIMLQQKRAHKKLVVDWVNPEKRTDYLPGLRDDNRWMQYELDTLPKSEADWDAPRYMHKAQGFFGWRNTVEMYAPAAEQPNLKWTRDEMNDVQQVVFDFFRDKANVEALMKFWALEEKKGQDKFRRNITYVVRSLLGMFGDVFVENFVGPLPELVTSKELVEGNHRCAAEVIAGLIRGCKHWPFDEVDNLYKKHLVPLIRQVLENVTPETDGFWEMCFSTACDNTDPSRQHWLYETLLEEPLRQITSHNDCSRIVCFQSAFNKQVWRMNSVAHRLMDYLRPHLGHQFQNVRQAIGFMLVNVMEMDFQYPAGPEPGCPRVAVFLRDVLVRIEILRHREYPAQPNEDEEFLEAVRVFKTVAFYMYTFINVVSNGNQKEYFDLLAIACRLERSEQDEELAMHCTKLLSMLAHALTLADCMPVALEKISEVSHMASWSARLAGIGVLQVLVFNNMAVVLSCRESIDTVQEIVLRLLEDKVVEVRVLAAQVLGGLLHCKFLPSTSKLLELFKKKCQTKVKRTAKTSMSDDMEGLLEMGEQVALRHGGVLGLCAFIAAYPYDIPDFVPEVFEQLGAHLNDPQPIPSTIRKTVGEFKRTHIENWATHQMKFNENQLAVLTSIVPPSYYA